ncbi:FAD:protein FMN transferase [Plebeiibacterium sediminum]|uniref:FAD:protein FMN transferase n=1 Tax=Plebeiibacterium sediminum TaxID=2992112 RepID=A0AAE3M1X6_9BACT|nr:FAD:protein FMN transferase [Plebeiobacterium sediminum]MCW3785707.1 FAD:protein FMN transferase [Plebeiobacterium sediminum]
MFLTIVAVLIGIQGFADNIYKQTTKLMGCRFEITVVAQTQDQGNQFIQLAIGEISRIEDMISSWDENSETALINRNAGIKPVVVSGELIQLIERSLKISNLTDGAFDITYASMDKIWKFDGSMTEMPSKEQIQHSIRNVDFHNIIINKENQTVFLKNKGMRIGFGAIGKGYAADRAKALLQKQGVTAGIINASGDLNTWGTQPDGKDWMVAIVNPLNKSKVFSWMPVKNSAVVTSGNYENFVKFNGETYSHIINPKTGYPSKGILSVTIFTMNAEIADALATSVFVMGVDAGLNMINQLNGVECIIVDDNSKVIKSDKIQLSQESSLIKE